MKEELKHELMGMILFIVWMGVLWVCVWMQAWSPSSATIGSMVFNCVVPGIILSIIKYVRILRKRT